MSDSIPAIRAIFGHEPRRDGEAPTGYMIGTRPNGAGPDTKVTRIEEQVNNHGSYEDVWFMVFDGETLVAKMNAAAVAEVLFQN